MTKLLFTILFLFISSTALAGDYMLYISNDSNSSCAAPARKAQKYCKEEFEAKYIDRCMKSNPIKSSAVVSNSLKQYFSGQKTDIAILGPAFINGHIHFCGKKEVDEVYQTLIELKEKGVAVNKSHLDDFIVKVKNIRK